ncbi:MAG: HAD family phosphatase [Chloroflexi bacterium]|nr:HAD family phosphatase [Chloroflexota bacterium]
MTDPKAIIFDMDGLLVDSEILWADAESRLLAARGKGYNEMTPRDEFVGLRIDEFLDRLCATFDIDESRESLYDELVGDMLQLIPDKVVPMPGAREILDYVRLHNIPCAIASSSPQSIIEAVIETQGWGDFVQVRVSAESVGRGKPAPDVYLETARRLGVKPADCLALEDSPNGARAAVAAGMTCYAVPDLSHSPVTAFEGITPYVFDSLHTVLAQLTGGRPG